MKLRIKFLIFCIVALLTRSLYSQVPDVAMKDVPGFKARLSEMSGKVNTIESDFVQEKNLSVLSKAIISKGYFCFKKENNIRWEYFQPYKYLIIISNNQMFIKEDNNQKKYDIQSNKMFQEMNKFISGCIQGDILKNDKEYNLKYYEDTKSFFVTMIPNAPKMREMLNEVQIWFDKSDYTVTHIKMLESGGDFTKIDFINKKLNTDLPVEKFSLK
jgi:outer membrane lipoprotein-sorting protein